MQINEGVLCSRIVLDVERLDLSKNCNSKNKKVAHAIILLNMFFWE